MEFQHVKRRSQRPMSERMLERYPMTNSDLFSSDNSYEDEATNLVHRNMRHKAPVKIPFRVEHFGNGSSCQIPNIRPQSTTNCMKCNQIRTNPRFRPSSFHSYGKLINDHKWFMSDNDDESSDDQLRNTSQRPYSKNRRRTYHKMNPR